MLYIERFTVNPIQENTYLLYDDSREGVLVDCGCASPEERTLLAEAVEAKGIKLRMLLCTHLHFDHIWGAAWAVQRWSLPIYCHKDDLKLHGKASEQLKLFAINAPVEDLEPEAYTLIGQGDIIRFGHTALEVRHVPGHSPGHIVFYHDGGEGQRSLISGDTLFRGDIGRTDLWGGNYEQLITAIGRELFSLPPDTRVYPGHGDATSIGYELAHNPYF